ncbi:PAS domain-containing protein [Parvibaculum sp.]|uniref:PAS domain-containing protein n=1 Tax=Parvibaculum sp. TaxID=2024848 RepID=UPI002D1FC0CF|nr:PAS domain-containing protein [Parvibaculum sp.]
MTQPAEAIRAQLIIPEQRELFDYWCSKCPDDGFPKRGDIHPFELKPLLPSLSLFDVLEGGPLSLRVRLAGTRLRDYLGVETTGRCVADFDLGDQRGYWEAAYREVVEGRRPAQGVVPLTPWKAPDVFQFWLRLPLVDEAGHIVMVFGHDAFLHSEKAHALAGRANLRIA